MKWQVEHVAETASTMQDVKERARRGAPDGFAIVAERQTAGHGTKGRSWASPRGGWYASFVVRGVKNARLLTLALANAVADALEIAGVEPAVKWVNDIWVGGKKIAGILVEGEATGDEIDFLVCGIGLNANGKSAALGVPGATTLEEQLGCESCVPDLEAVVWDSVSRWRQTLEADPAAVLAAFARRDALRGQRVRAEGATGVAQGIDDGGRLLVATTAGVVAVGGGTVEVV
ncbi:MAG: biotin--[acetyl-CoA-carboxylase] ligase [Thermoplasmatota archaeon]